MVKGEAKSESLYHPKDPKAPVIESHAVFQRRLRHHLERLEKSGAKNIKNCRDLTARVG
jgi:hypothetical protein